MDVSAVVTATATGFVNGTATVTVTDNDSELTITAAPSSVSESAAAESVTYTLSRNTANVAQAPALVVNLTSGTPGRLTVANSTVTIPAGQASVTFKGSPFEYRRRWKCICRCHCVSDRIHERHGNGDSQR